MEKIDDETKQAIDNLSRSIRLASILLVLTLSDRFKTIESILKMEKDIQEKL